MEDEAETTRERRGFLHQPSRDGERRARRDRELDARPGPDSWTAPWSRSLSARTASIPSTSSSGGSPPSDTPRSIEPRDATSRTPSSRAAWTSASMIPGRPREDVVMVEHRRAAGERKLGEARARRRVLGLGVDPRPDRVELPQPREQVGLLGTGARQGLVQVVVRVDEARRDDRAAEVDDLGAVRVPRPRADVEDRPVLHEHPAPRCSAPASSIVTIRGREEPSHASGRPEAVEGVREHVDGEGDVLDGGGLGRWWLTPPLPARTKSIPASTPPRPRPRRGRPRSPARRRGCALRCGAQRTAHGVAHRPPARCGPRRRGRARPAAA